MKNFKKIFFSLFFFSAGFLFSQTPVNAYAQIISINDSTLTLGSVDEQYDSFEDGGKIIIMQMQGAQVSDTSNSSSFGNVSSIGAAGLFETATIFSHTETTGGIPVSILLSSKLSNVYSTGGVVQVISFPELGGGSSFTTANDINCKLFDGQKGGVLAFEVQGNLFLKNNIIADGLGFKGGTLSSGNSTGNCDPSLYAGPFNSDRSLKGQGIYKVSANLNAGRAHSANGGGGGVLHNGGGAGGGNYSAGGNGGQGWDKCPNDFINGFGGSALTSVISTARIFLGGGGGGGNENSTYGSSGANGGGIIIMKCDSIISSGSCSSVRISANGNSVGNGGQDGQGGGGAGGSILLNISNVKSTSFCPLTITANGGNGGNVSGTSLPQGGGGGGGQGVIMILCGGSEQDVVMQTKNGTGGKNMVAFTTTYADNGAGADDQGIFIGISSDTIPVLFSSYSAMQDSMTIKLTWTTTYEKNVSQFTVQKKYQNNPWQTLGSLAGHGAGVFSGTFNYSFTDPLPNDGANNYRLKITDTTGCNYYSPTWYGSWTRPYYETEITVYPGPAPDQYYIRGNFPFDESWFNVYDARGRLVAATFNKFSDKLFQVLLPDVADGIYFVRYFSNGKKGAKKFSVIK